MILYQNKQIQINYENNFNKNAPNSACLPEETRSLIALIRETKNYQMIESIPADLSTFNPCATYPGTLCEQGHIIGIHWSSMYRRFDTAEFGLSFSGLPYLRYLNLAGNTNFKKL
jgi:hypothetical protein